MKKEDLIKLKKKISELSDKEQKLRDLYLKDLASGKLQGPMVGYPSIDKPSLKYYREKPVKYINPDQTIYNMVFDQDNMDAEAIGYLGSNMTFRELKDKVDECAKAFKNNGVKDGDTVLFGVSNSPETIISLIALTVIGAQAKFFDLRANKEDIIKYSNLNNCKMIVSFDAIIPKVKESLDSTNVEKVIVISPVNSISPIKRALYNFNQKIHKENITIPNDSRYITYNNFIKTANNEKISENDKVSFDKNRPSIMIQSSGTTGKPKTIVHSDYSATQSARELSYSDLPLGKNKTVLVALPPWIAYCLGNAILYPLATGSKVELCPNFDPDSVSKNIGKFTISFAAPFHYRYLLEHKYELSNSKLSYLYNNVDCMISGGDKISPEENKEWEESFKTVVVNGYGNNEGWGSLTVNPTKANRYGTVGIPKYDETIIAYDVENDVELPYGEVGEIISKTNTMFLGYNGNEEATKEVKKDHGDGYWLHTGDLGYIDNEGYIHLEGRARRVIVRMGFKISAYTIEDNITKSDLVKECVAVAVKDDFEEHVPMAYIVLKDEPKDEEKVREQLYEFCSHVLKEYEIPKYIKLVRELPYTQNGKYNFRLLEDLGNEYVENLSKETSYQRIKKN